MREHFEAGRAAELQEIPHEVAAVFPRQRREHVRRHERADFRSLVDVSRRERVALARRIDHHDGISFLFLHDSLNHAAVDQRERIGTVLGLDGAGRPVDALDDFLRREARGHGRQFRAHGPALAGHLVARRAARCGGVEYAGSAAGVALRPGVGEGLLDELRTPLWRPRLARGRPAQPDNRARDHGGSGRTHDRGDRQRG